MDSARAVFSTLGMFIIDTFEFKDATDFPPDFQMVDRIGGAGTFASVGARIW